MIGAYLRVSSSSQRTDSQRSEIESWLDAHGIEPASVRWYEDKETGKTMKRKAFDRLQADIFTGKVKQVLIWKLDRLSRRLKDGVNVLADWCDHGIKITVITQQIELNGAVGRMIAAVMLGLSEIELEYKRERQAAGITVAKRRGAYKGRKKGTTKAKPARARDLRDQGLTISEIQQAMGVSKSTVLRYLTHYYP